MAVAGKQTQGIASTYIQVYDGRAAAAFGARFMVVTTIPACDALRDLAPDGIGLGEFYAHFFLADQQHAVIAGSNRPSDLNLVGVTGFEPATYTSRT